MIPGRCWQDRKDMLRHWMHGSQNRVVARVLDEGHERGEGTLVCLVAREGAANGVARIYIVPVRGRNGAAQPLVNRVHIVTRAVHLGWHVAHHWPRSCGRSMCWFRTRRVPAAFFPSGCTWMGRRCRYARECCLAIARAGQQPVSAYCLARRNGLAALLPCCCCMSRS